MEEVVVKEDIALNGVDYIYMLKSIKDNNNINFRKLSDNLNFELNGIKIVKPKENKDTNFRKIPDNLNLE